MSVLSNLGDDAHLDKFEVLEWKDKDGRLNLRVHSILWDSKYDTAGIPVDIDFTMVGVPELRRKMAEEFCALLNSLLDENGKVI